MGTDDKNSVSVLVRMVTTAAGPKGVYLAGRTAVVDGATAATWVAGGYAVYAAAPAPAPAPSSSPRQTATLPRGETAVHPPPLPAGAPVTEIRGIGPKTAAALAEMGIVTVAELAAEDPTLVADRLNVPENRVLDWQEAAWELVEGVDAGNDAGNAAGG